MGVMQVMRSLLMAQPHRESIVGTSGIATFDDDFKAPMKIVVPFTPIQEGTGTASKDNIRPFSGFDGCEIDGTGLNAFDLSKLVFTSGYMLQKDTGAIISSRYYKTTRQFYPCKQLAGRNITTNIAGTTTSSSYPSFAFYSDAVDGTCVGTMVRSNNVPYTKTVPQNAKYMRVTIPTEQSTSNKYILFGNTVPNPVPKFGTAIIIAFTNPSTGDPITVYRGTLTIYEDGTGTLEVTHALITLDGDVRKVTLVSTGRFNVGVSTIYGSSTTVNTASSHYPGTSYNSGRTRDFCIWTGNNGGDVRINDSDYSTAEEYNAFLQEQYQAGTPVQVYYRLKSNRTYNFTAEEVGQLKSFIGQNNVWTDLNGDPTVGYWKHG